MEKKPSSIDVGRLARVSQATVSYVLNGKGVGFVSSETQSRVLAAARELGYRPNSLAKALLKGKTNTVGLFVSFLGSRFHADIVLGAQELLEEHGYSLLLTAAETDHKARSSQISFMMNHRVDAIILVGGFYEDLNQPNCLSEVINERVPCVVVDDSYAGGTVDCVMSDDAAGLSQAVHHLKQLGHRRIAFIPPTWKGATAEARLAGYYSAMREAGLEATADLCRTPSGNGAPVIEGVLEMLRSHDRPTAIIAANDHFLGYALRAISTMGMSVHRDVALVGYGNQEISMVMEITTIDQQPRLMGKRAAERLLERIQSVDLEPKVIRTKTILVARESTIGNGLDNDERQSIEGAQL